MQEEKEGVLLMDSWTIIEFIHKSLINCGRAANERDLKIRSFLTQINKQYFNRFYGV